jgi:hypothetical protein
LRGIKKPQILPLMGKETKFWQKEVFIGVLGDIVAFTKALTIYEIYHS